jgi:hypothetical protein
MCQMPVVPALGQNSAQSSFSPYTTLVGVGEALEGRLGGKTTKD